MDKKTSTLKTQTISERKKSQLNVEIRPAYGLEVNILRWPFSPNGPTHLIKPQTRSQQVF